MRLQKGLEVWAANLLFPLKEKNEIDRQIPTAGEKVLLGVRIPMGLRARIERV